LDRQGNAVDRSYVPKDVDLDPIASRPSVLVQSAWPAASALIPQAMRELGNERRELEDLGRMVRHARKERRLSQ
jgi:hypothetical protein